MRNNESESWIFNLSKLFNKNKEKKIKWDKMNEVNENKIGIKIQC